MFHTANFNFDIPLWLIITFSVVSVTWPLLLAAGGTAIVALFAAAAAKSVLALKVAAVAAAVFFSPLAIGVIGAPVLKAIEGISNAVPDSSRENTPLIHAGADANKDIRENSAMENAVLARRHGAMRRLCARGYKLAKDDGTGSGIVEFAVQARRYGEAALLLELGAVPCDRYEYKFMDNITTFMYILEESVFFKYARSDEEAEEENARFEKDAADLRRLFALLVEKGADLDARTDDHWKQTALLRLAWSYATTRNDAPKLPLAKILLDAGADVNAADAYGKTALHYFAEISWADELDDIANAIRLFSSYNPDLTLRDEKGNTPLDIFLRSCRDDDRDKYPKAYAEIVRLLTPAAPTETPKREAAAVSEESDLRAAAPLRVAKAEDAPHIERDDMSDDW